MRWNKTMGTTALCRSMLQPKNVHRCWGQSSVESVCSRHVYTKELPPYRLGKKGHPRPPRAPRQWTVLTPTTSVVLVSTSSNIAGLVWLRFRIRYLLDVLHVTIIVTDRELSIENGPDRLEVSVFEIYFTAMREKLNR